MGKIDQTIYLRAIEPSDIDLLFAIENDTQLWEVSHTQAPFSRHILERYLENSHQDIYEAKQLRLVISKGDTALGFVDLFEFEPQHKRVGVGIMVLENHRGKGVARAGLQLIIDFAFSKLDVHQLFANISEDNGPSVYLFEDAGFTFSGQKRDWNFSNGIYKNELLYQLVRPIID